MYIHISFNVQFFQGQEVRGQRYRVSQIYIFFEGSVAVAVTQGIRSVRWNNFADPFEATIV